MGNCHINRETERAILDEGFEIVQIERESMRKALPIVRPTIRGIAIKPDPRMTSDVMEPGRWRAASGDES